MITSKFKDNKSQAALEFLTTYGWAFLVILIMISTLAYFGLLKPSKVLPDRCNFGAEFSCLDYKINSTGLKIKLKSSIGDPIIVPDLISLSTESTIPFSCPSQQNSSSLLTGWKTGEVKDIQWEGCNSAAAGLIVGEKGKVLLTLRYYSVTSGPSYTREAQGEIFSTVVPS